MNTPDSHSPTMPVLFVGHGSPMNALSDNVWSRGFSRLGREVPRPAAILAISAHWQTTGTQLTAGRAPKTIHDFSGFPPELSQITYEAPGSPELAERVLGLLGSDSVSLSSDWGLDHGTWSVLRRTYPAADIPIVQLSLDRTLSHTEHIERGRSLRPLRDEGVLLLGSGNLTHNLRDAFSRLSAGRTDTPTWAQTFEKRLLAAIENRNEAELVTLLESEIGKLCHPTDEHILPLLYCYGAALPSSRIDSPVSGFFAGSLSMRSLLFR